MRQCPLSRHAGGNDAEDLRGTQSGTAREVALLVVKIECESLNPVDPSRLPIHFTAGRDVHCVPRAGLLVYDVRRHWQLLWGCCGRAAEQLRGLWKAHRAGRAAGDEMKEGMSTWKRTAFTKH